MKNKTFVTIFTRLKNVDLIKLPGMTLYYISRLTNNNIKCSLVTLNNDNYEYYSSYEEYYKLIVLEKSKKQKSPYRQVFSYLRKEALKIDILNLYHLDMESLLYSIIYKHYNKNGKLLLQLDADERIKEFFTQAERKGLLKFTNKIRPLKRIILQGLLRKSDYIAIESRNLFDYLLSTGIKLLEQKLILNPYGINIEEFKKYSNPEIKKENIFLTVGRIGDYQKNNELLMNVIKEIENLQGWKFYFVGPIEKEFEKNIRDLFESYPGLKESVIFTGEIQDRRKLCEYMQSAKVFCLTSRYESWGIVLIEAAYFNNYIISTDVGCAKDVIQSMVSGSIFKDETDLKSIFQSVINGNIDVNNPERPSKDYYLEMNSWDKTVAELLKVIN